MTPVRIFLLVSLAMLAFAGNSLLCRLALKSTAIDAASFTSVRLVSGALALVLLAHLRGGTRTLGGSWLSALALFVYAAGFSFAYVELPVATGALLLYGAIQATMIGHGVWKGESLGYVQVLGLLLALGGLAGLLLPGFSASTSNSSILMTGAGIAWGVYSLRGKAAGDPGRVTAGNFLRAVPMTVMLSLLMFGSAELDPMGIAYAVMSGALASGMGYIIWYAALPALTSTHASIVQLSVPVITVVGGDLLLGEAVTPRLLLATSAILGGIAMVILAKRRPAPTER